MLSYDDIRLNPRPDPGLGLFKCSLFFFTLVTGPRRSLSLELSDTRVYGPQIRARLGTTARFYQVAVLKLRAIPSSLESGGRTKHPWPSRFWSRTLIDTELVDHIHRGISGRGTTKEKDARGTPIQSHISPSVLVCEERNVPNSVESGGRTKYPRFTLEIARVRIWPLYNLKGVNDINLKPRPDSGLGLLECSRRPTCLPVEESLPPSLSRSLSVSLSLSPRLPSSPRRALRGGISKVNFEQSSSSFGDKCPQNGSKNEEMAPRTKTGYPHIGPSVVPERGAHQTSLASRAVTFEPFPSPPQSRNQTTPSLLNPPEPEAGPFHHVLPNRT